MDPTQPKQTDDVWPPGVAAGMRPVSAALLLIGVAALIMRLDLSFSAGHMDEYDYLFIGRQLHAGHDWPSYTYVFGSNLSWYIYGWADQLFGGLTGARAAAAALGVLSLLGVYLFVVQLWQSRQIAAISTLLMAVYAGHIYISKAATYDIVSFCAFVFALAAMVHACRQVRGSYLSAILGAGLLALAVTSKYTAVVYLPLIAIVCFLRAPRIAFLGGTLTASLLLLYAWRHWDALQVLYEVQINGVHEPNATRSEILVRAINHVGVPLLFWFMALVHVATADIEQRARHSQIMVGLLIFALPLFFYHLMGRNLISLYKHLNFSALFLLPAAAWLMVTLGQQLRRQTKPVTMTLLFALAIMFTGFNAWQLRAIEQGYPDQTGLMALLGGDLPPQTTVISEDPYLFRYLFYDKVDQASIKETTWLDNNADGQYLTHDVRDALWDRKFELVLLNDQIHPAANATYREILQLRGYTTVFEREYFLSPVMTHHRSGRTSLYRRLPDFADADLADADPADGSASR